MKEVIVSNKTVDLLALQPGTVVEVVTGASRWYFTVTQLVKDAPTPHISLVSGVAIQSASRRFVPVLESPSLTLCSRFIRKGGVMFYGQEGQALNSTGDVHLALNASTSRSLL